MADLSKMSDEELLNHIVGSCVLKIDVSEPCSQLLSRLAKMRRENESQHADIVS